MLRMKVCVVLALVGFASSVLPPDDGEDLNLQVEQLPEVEKQTYLGAQVISLQKNHSSLVEQLIPPEDLDIWSGNETHADIFIPGEKVDEVKERLSLNKVTYSVRIADVQRALEEQNPPSSAGAEEEELDGRKGHDMTWKKYHTLEVIHSYLDYLGESYPDVATVGVLGQSLEGHPLKYVKVATGSPNASAIFIDGGFHAREWITPASATYFLHELVEARSSLPPEVQSIDFYIMPVANPDGYLFSYKSARLWRKNRSLNPGSSCVGTDLNRNFDFHWGGVGSSANPCSISYKGTAPFSEPETKALSDFVLHNTTNLKGYVSLHSYGQFILTPFGHTERYKPSDYSDVLEVGHLAAESIKAYSGRVYQVGSPPEVIYPVTGISQDWMKEVANVKYTYTIEMRDTGKYGFTLPAQFILPNAQETFEAIKVLAAAECWERTENKLVEKLRQNEQQKTNMYNKYTVEVGELKERLREANDTIAILKVELSSFQEEKGDLEKVNENLRGDVNRLSCELEEARMEAEEGKRKGTQESGEGANMEVTRRQTEIVRLNGLISELRGELEKIRLGSVMRQPGAEGLPGTLSQLQAALAIERDTARSVLKEKENMARELMDLRRQVKEMEKILLKRAKTGCGLPLGDVYNPEFRESLDKRCRELEMEVAQRRTELAARQETLSKLQEKYEQDLQKLEQEVKRYKKENESLKQSMEVQQQQKPGRGGSSESGGGAKEDAHLLATIRGLKTELGAREKEVARLTRELEDARRTNRRLQKERTKALNSPAKTTVNHGVKEAVDNRAKGGGEPENLAAKDKDYNPVHYQEEPCSFNYLRTENRTLKEEIKKLELDLISLHNKRIQDLRCLQEEHEAGMEQMVREHAGRHGSCTVAQLQGQLYTQQMVIHHLKEHLKIVEGGAEEAALVKTERDHLEATLMESNKKIARLQELQSPESVQYSSLLEKLDFLERRHEIREQKLQSIVRDLLSKQQQQQPLEGGLSCSSNCRDKLLIKNREICYYRAQMDNILDTLAEFRWNK